MLKKRLHSYWYSTTHRVKHNPPLEFEWANGEKDYVHTTVEKSNNGTLYSHAKYPTKITVDDLPNYYMYGRFYKEWGYIDTANITHIIYKPNTWVNHLFRDDTFFLWYNNKLVDTKSIEHIWDSNYDMLVEGTWVTDLIAHLTVFNTNIDTKLLISQVADKIELYNKNHPDEYDCMSYEDWFKSLNTEILKLEDLNCGSRPTNKITTESDKS